MITNQKKETKVDFKGFVNHNSRIAKVTREVVAVLIWTYTFIKLFIFDIDTYLVRSLLPNHTYLLKYKFTILIGLVAVFWLFTKNKQIFIWSLYILFYPLILLFWRIPYFIFKQKSWVIAFTFINGIISFIVSLKYLFVTSAIYTVSATILLTSTNEALLVISCISILIILILTFYNRFEVIFKKSNLLSFYTTFFSRMDNSTLIIEEEITKTPVELLDEKQLERRTTNLQSIVLFNRIHLFIAKKLREYQNSKMNYAYYIVSIIGVVAFTILSFTFVNLSLYKIDPDNFSFESPPSLFTFIYYSFNNLLSTPISELKAITPISQSISMFSTFCAFLIGVILVSLILSVRSQKHQEELNEVISGFERQGELLEKLILVQYKIKNIEDALVELEKLKAILINIIYKITDNIK
ncbi:hypothetical protein [Cytobacillus kochii]|uniref:hypothetical protein n=1 Tax=Cytobacillus kochii TaxID=859143 RepID=UPI002480E924|nr:hypothetical protein [Cytobacillus kochii]